MSSNPNSSTLILVVEDDEAVQDVLVALLELEGYRVATANHGQAAFDFLKSHAKRPALIILDLMMPVMNGKEFLKKAKNHPDYAAIPIVVLSAMTEFIKTEGASSILSKPISLDKLLGVVEKFTPR